jgi:DNA repair photolyase
MRRYSGHKEAWGEFVDIKVNAPELLRKQLVKVKKGTVWISSVCDPYQPLEAKYKLTRQCLKEFTERQFPLNIQTKSKLVLRDLDLFLQFEQIEVGFTITTDDERTAKLFEARASSVKDRIHALKKLHSAGIKTFAFIGPLLPGHPEILVESLDGKVDKVYIDKMNYLGTIRGYYHRLNMEGATTQSFFNSYKQRLIRELRKRKMKFEALF